MESYPPDTERVIERYVAGTATPDERASVEQGMATNAEYRRIVESLQAAWYSRLHSAQHWDAALAYQRGKAARRVPLGRSSARSSPRPLWYSLAALVLVGFVVFGLSKVLIRQTDSRFVGPVTTYTTRNGQRAEIKLPDGTRVSLNVASRLDVPADFVAGDRTVTLYGEALFSVAHQSGAAFTVLSGQTRTQVLGTTFAVRHYANDTIAFVAVRDGKVSVHSPVMPSVIVTAQRQVTMTAAGDIHLQSATPERFAFASGVLPLDGIPLKDAITDLDRWYDADIRIPDTTLATEHIRATLPAGSLTDLADILEFMFAARVVRQGRVLTLYPR
jgi:ferric-dicitrate binding protein FerR (iron transport regulator)